MHIAHYFSTLCKQAITEKLKSNSECGIRNSELLLSRYAGRYLKRFIIKYTGREMIFRPVLFHIKVFKIRPRKPQTRCLRRCPKRAARCRPKVGNRGHRIPNYEFN